MPVGGHPGGDHHGLGHHPADSPGPCSRWRRGTRTGRPPPSTVQGRFRLPPDRRLVRQQSGDARRDPAAGNAGSNTTADHIAVLSAAIAQVPGAHRKRLLVRADGAGASHGLLDWLTLQDAKRGRSVEYSVGFAVTDPVRAAIATVPSRTWTPAMDADGDVRDGSDVAEVTDLLDLTRWPAGMRVIIRRERPHPGAQLSPVRGSGRVALPGVRHQHRRRAAGVPGSPTPRPRPPGRGPDPARQRLRPRPVPVPRVRHQPGLAAGSSPIAADLTAWLRLLALPDTLKACEPKALRYRLLHVPARLTRGGRRRRLRLPATWPWAAQIKTVFDTDRRRSRHPPEDRSPTLTAHDRTPRRTAPQRHAAPHHSLHKRPLRDQRRMPSADLVNDRG